MSLLVAEPGEMPLYVAFHQAKIKRSSEKDIQFYFKMITCETSLYTMFAKTKINFRERKYNFIGKLCPANQREGGILFWGELCPPH